MTDEMNVLIVNKVTGRIVKEFPTITAAAKFMGIARTTADNQAVRHSIPRSSRFCVRYRKDYDPHEKFSRQTSAPVIAKKDGLTLVFDNALQAVKALHFSHTQVVRNATDGKELDGIKLHRLRFFGDVHEF